MGPPPLCTVVTVPRTTATLLIILSAMLVVQRGALGQSAWQESFEGPNPSWQDAGGDARYSIQQHRRLPGAGHTGQGCEWVELAGQGGSCVYLGHEVGRPWVIEDLRPAVWVRSDRAGLQFLAEIALPRTPDPRTGRPVTTLVFGSTYTAVGRWQQLVVADIPRLLTRQLHLLRSQMGANVDEHQAYLNRVMLNAYGGPGITNVWIDDLHVAGHVSSGVGQIAPPAGPGDAGAIAASATQYAGLGGLTRPDLPRQGPPGQDLPPDLARPELQLSGSTLLVRGRPMFPRAIQYQGERLATLKQLGFNTIWIRQIPAGDFMAESRRLGLWLVCPPPRPPAADAAAAALAPLAPIGAEFQAVLAWDLTAAAGDLRGSAGEQLEASRQWAEAVRLADGRQRRPLICCPTSDLRGYSRHVDLLLIDRRPLGTSLEIPDYGVWVQRQPLLARPGTPLWTVIQTQVSESLRRQLAALTPGRPVPSAVDLQRMRLLVYTAISSGSRGILFQSQTSLDSDDLETRTRAMALQLVNLELDLIEPWAAAGSFVAVAESDQRQVNAAVLRSDRARLVLPMLLAPGAQCVAPAAVTDALALVVPGVPESINAYELTASRLLPLRHKRGTGGTRVTLDEFGLTGLVLLAQDPLVVDAVTRRAALNGRPSAELERQLVARQLDAVGQVVQQSGRHVPPRVNVNEQLAAARQNLQSCDAQLAAGDFQSASLYARRVSRPLRLLERAFWETATAGWGSPVASPATAAFVTLPWHWNLVDRLAASHVGPNRLPGGDFEDFALMLHAGWRHYQHSTAAIHTAADLVPEAAHSGRWGLRLTARADNPENPPAILETLPLWITSPPVPVEAGRIVRVHGWVNIPSAITGSVDGLMVTDSLSGPDLALRIDKTNAWREFTLFRVVEQPGTMTVTFTLSGLGEVRLDDVSVEMVEKN